MASIKQKKAVANLVENGGNVTKAMRDAGYSEGTINSPSNLTDSDGYKEIVDPVVDRMLKARIRALDRLSKVEDKADYRALIAGCDTLTKNIELLSGKATERVETVDGDVKNMTDEQRIAYLQTKLGIYK